MMVLWELGPLSESQWKIADAIFLMTQKNKRNEPGYAG
jgi:hypothetical protein